MQIYCALSIIKKKIAKNSVFLHNTDHHLKYSKKAIDDQRIQHRALHIAPAIKESDETWESLLSERKNTIKYNWTGIWLYTEKKNRVYTSWIGIWTV